METGPGDSHRQNSSFDPFCVPIQIMAYSAPKSPTN